MSKIKELCDNIDKLITLETEKMSLLGLLKRSLLIADLIGVPPKDLTGVYVQTQYLGHGKPADRLPWRTEDFIVRLDGDEVCRKKLIDVPQDLWPDDVRAEYARYRRRVDRYRRKRSGV